MSEWGRCAECVCGVVTKNPATAKLLGLCPLLAVSNTALKAAVLSILLATVVALSSSITSLLRNCVSWRLKPMHHALIAAFATAVVVAMARIEHYELVAALGIYPALIASNCLVLSFIQELAEQNPLATTVTKLVRDVVYVIAFFVLFGALREFAAYGSVLNDLQLVHGVSPLGLVTTAGSIPMMASAPGALLALALCLAGANAIAPRSRETEIAPATAAGTSRSAASVATSAKSP
jgi:electron transport complex protein RnfE